MLFVAPAPTMASSVQNAPTLAPAMAGSRCLTCCCRAAPLSRQQRFQWNTWFLNSPPGLHLFETNLVLNGMAQEMICKRKMLWTAILGPTSTIPKPQKEPGRTTLREEESWNFPDMTHGELRESQVRKTGFAKLRLRYGRVAFA